MINLSDLAAAAYVDVETLSLCAAGDMPREHVSVGVPCADVAGVACDWQSPGPNGWAIAEMASDCFATAHPLTAIEQFQLLAMSDHPDHANRVRIAAAIAWLVWAMQIGYLTAEEIA